MMIKHKLDLDLVKRGVPQRVDAVQDDSCSRQLELRLYANGTAFALPEDCTVVVRYQKPDGNGGAYDTLPDGSCAWALEDNALLVTLAPQVCTVAGTTKLAVTLMDSLTEISTFTLLLDVQAAPGSKQVSQEYVNIRSFLPQAKKATVGQMLKVAEVDAYGNVTSLTTGEGSRYPYTDGKYFWRMLDQVDPITGSFRVYQYPPKIPLEEYGVFDYANIFRTDELICDVSGERGPVYYATCVVNARDLGGDSEGRYYGQLYEKGKGMRIVSVEGVYYDEFDDVFQIPSPSEYPEFNVGTLCAFDGGWIYLDGIDPSNTGKVVLTIRLVENP